jgi:hypothetical protein
MDALSGQAVEFPKAEKLLSSIVILVESFDAALKLSNVRSLEAPLCPFSRNLQLVESLPEQLRFLPPELFPVEVLDKYNL